MKANTPVPSATRQQNPLYIQVAIPSPLRRLFDYLPPENHELKLLQKGTRVLIPFGRRQMIGIIVSTSAYSSVSHEKLKAVIRVLDETPIISEDIMQLCSWASTYYHYSLGETFMQAIPKALRQGKQLPITKTIYWSLYQPLTSEQQQQLQRSRKQLETALLLNSSSNLSVSEQELKEIGIKKNILKNLDDKGLVTCSETETKPISFKTSKAITKEQAFSLNPEQRFALDRLLEHLGSYQPFLLDGITGSGKTEVYLQAIAAALAAGKQTLVLVPEIGLTPQTVGRFKRRFNTPVTCLHSGLSDGERLKGWYQSATESAGIIIATRSGVFTPLPSMGLIIVDEEHDASYKQQDTLRYNARDLAIYRARQARCPIVLGSATPSLETFYNAVSGRFQHLKLRKRAGEASPPKIELLDMRQQNKKDGLAVDLISRIATQLANGNQVMVFLNRRGYAPSVICHDCGTVIDCPHCDAHMTIHRHPPHMHCHHCDYQKTIPNQCASCQSTNIQPAGQGTERTEQTLGQLFPGYPVIRIDRDSTRKKNALDNLLDTINSGEPCILLGTQMLAKGHHFPAVTLVIVLNADAGLFSSDFRGVERTGQLIVQVAGRAGRGDRPGQVVIQTYNPQHSALQTLATKNYTLFIESLLQDRVTLKLPPTEYLAMVRAESAHSKECENLLHVLRQSILSLGISGSFRVLGPIPAPMEKRQGRFRWQLLIQSPQRSGIHNAINFLLQHLEEKKLPKHIRWSIDIDPQDMT